MTPGSPATALVRALLADDHALVRAGLRQLLEHTGLVTIVAEADDGLPVPDLVADHQVALAILDISMPHLSGLDLLPVLRRRFPALKILMLSMHTDAEYVREALQRGANGFVPKDARPEILRQALTHILGGETYVTPEMRIGLAVAPPPAASTGPLDALPPRQRQLLDLMGQGHSTREIAQLLGVGVKTVETHRARLIQALKLRHGNDLLRFAMQFRAGRHAQGQTPKMAHGQVDPSVPHQLS